MRGTGPVNPDRSPPGVFLPIKFPQLPQLQPQLEAPLSTLATNLFILYFTFLSFSFTSLSAILFLLLALLFLSSFVPLLPLSLSFPVLAAFDFSSCLSLFLSFFCVNEFLF